MRVTLLGTGMPQPDPARRGPSQVVEVDRRLVLIDCGAGTLHRLLEAGFDGRAIKQIALTHLHSDHCTGLADVLWAGWTQHWWAERPTLIGPPGTAEFVSRLIGAFEYDVGVRTLEGGLSAEVLEPMVTEIGDGWKLEDTSGRLTAIRVDHAPVDQAFGFRIDSDAGSVVVSGDTRKSQNLIERARGADLLVHEVIWRTGMERLIGSATDDRQRARWERILGYHTPAEHVGEIAGSAAVGAVAMSHIIMPGGSPADLIKDARRSYDGPLSVGEDLQSFDVDRRSRN